jgi:hypothetical protein
LPLYLAMTAVGGSQVAHAQTQQPQQTQVANQAISWYVLSSTVRFSDTFSVYGEIQPRLAGFATSMQQFQVRAALQYHVKPTLFFGVGYSFVETWQYGEFPVAAAFPEHRMYEQAQGSHKLGRVEFHHRGRLEQRFLGRMTKDDTGTYQLTSFTGNQRIRYQLRVVVPLTRPKLLPRTLFLSVYDELFLRLASELPANNTFDQNRISLSLGLQVTKEFSAQLGYLNQTLEKSDGLRFESNHGLLVSLTYNPDLRGK